MNSLAIEYRRSQLFARPVSGGKGPSPFVYGVRVANDFEPVNDEFAHWVEGDFNGQAEGVCANLVDGTKITGGFGFTLPALTCAPGALSTCERTTDLNAASASISSKESSGK